jgi:hypothetical protein
MFQLSNVVSANIEKETFFHDFHCWPFEGCCTDVSNTIALPENQHL